MLIQKKQSINLLMHAKVRIFSHFRHMFSTKNPKISYFNYYLPLPFKIFCYPLKNSCLSFGYRRTIV